MDQENFFDKSIAVKLFFSRAKIKLRNNLNKLIICVVLHKLLLYSAISNVYILSCLIINRLYYILDIK